MTAVAIVMLPFLTVTVTGRVAVTRVMRNERKREDSIGSGVVFSIH
jgi:hypothetical protein